MILTLENRGTVENPRYVLMNSFGHVYCEERGEFVETGGTRFHDVNPTTMKMQEIAPTLPL